MIHDVVAGVEDATVVVEPQSNVCCRAMRAMFTCTLTSWFVIVISTYKPLNHHSTSQTTIITVPLPRWLAITDLEMVGGAPHHGYTRSTNQSQMPQLYCSRKTSCWLPRTQPQALRAAASGQKFTIQVDETTVPSRRLWVKQPSQERVEEHLKS